MYYLAPYVYAQQSLHSKRSKNTWKPFDTSTSGTITMLIQRVIWLHMRYLLLFTAKCVLVTDVVSTLMSGIGMGFRPHFN